MYKRQVFLNIGAHRIIIFLTSLHVSVVRMGSGIYAAQSLDILPGAAGRLAIKAVTLRSFYSAPGNSDFIVSCRFGTF